MTTQSSGTAVCQSCAALMRRPEDFGTDPRGRPVATYCRRCYRDGRFVEPDLTRKEMVRRVVEEMRLGGMSEYSASREIASALSGLERWRRVDTGPSGQQEVPTQKAPRVAVSTRNDRR